MWWLLTGCGGTAVVDVAPVEPTPTPPVVDSLPARDTAVPEGLAGQALCVVEVQPAPSEARPAWLELWAPGPDDVLLAGWSLRGAGAGWVDLPRQQVVRAGERLVFSVDDTLGALDLRSPDGRLALRGPDDSRDVLPWQALPDGQVRARPSCCPPETCAQTLPEGSPGTDGLDRVWVSLLASGATWAALDGGQLPPPDWTTGVTGWTTGPAPLGYGEDGVATTLSYGADPEDKAITLWLVHELDGPPTAPDAAVLTLQRDDGAVVWLDGVPVVYSNAPDPGDDPAVPARSTVSGDGERTWWPYALPPAALGPGRHVLAVALKQAGPTSSDTWWDARLEVRVAAP